MARSLVKKSVSEPFLLFLCFYLLYAATSSGDLMADSQVRWYVAESIADSGWVSIDPSATRLRAEGRDGRFYSVWPPGSSLCLVPFVLGGRLMMHLPVPAAATAEMIGQFLASILLFPACGALCLVLVYVVALQAGCDRGSARVIAIATGLATMHWHHAISTGEESQVGLCLLIPV